MQQLTSGDHAVLLGVGPEPWDAAAETPLELYQRLRSDAPDRFAAAKRVSRALEPGLLQLLREDLAPQVRAGNWNTPDVWIVKAALWESADAWAVSGPPAWVFASVQAEMRRRGAKRAALGILLAGGTWRTGRMALEPGFQEDLGRALDAFQKALRDGLPPAPQGEADLDLVKRMFPQDDGSQAQLPEDARELWARIKRQRRVAREATRQRKVAEAKIRGWMAGAAVGRLPGGHRLGLKTVHVPGGRKGRRLVELR